jgi:hypothetical protein
MFSRKGNSEKKTCCVRPEFVYDSLATNCTPVFGKVYTRGASAWARVNGSCWPLRFVHSSRARGDSPAAKASGVFQVSRFE